MGVKVQNVTWTAPNTQKNTKNPVTQEDYDFSLEEGKSVFLKHCTPS